MPKKRQKEAIRGAYFVWLLGRRNGVWQADGRSNPHNAGRHTLETENRNEALKVLHELDLRMAVKLGLADPSVLKQQDGFALLTMEDGRKKYELYCSRPAIERGVTETTKARYKPVLDKFLAFAKSEKIQYWQQVTTEPVRKYLKMLEDDEYAVATVHFEMTTIKSIVGWMIKEDLLSPSHRLRVWGPRGRETTRYCYSPEEVEAMIRYCRSNTDLEWLGEVIMTLALTGLRIGELVALQFSNLDLPKGFIRLVDSSRTARKSERKDAARLKSHYNRDVAIHPTLLPILEGRPRHSDNRVFHGPRGGKLKADTVRNVLRREVLPALADRFPGQDGKPGILAGCVHSFRHFFVSFVANSGIPQQTLMAWVGHRESSMILHYYHLQEKESQRQMQKIPFPVFSDQAPGGKQQTAPKPSQE